MNLKNFFSFSLLSVLVWLSSVEVDAQCVQSVDFNTWRRTGDSTYTGSNGWTIQSSGSQLLSQYNTNFPRMFVGPDTLINVRVTGTFRVEDYSDDDYVGFVFGFKETWDQAWFGTQFMDHEYYLFDWKKNIQNYLGWVAQEGFSLDKVDGTFQRTNNSVFPSFWVHTNSANFNVLQTAYSTTNGWVAYTYYDFELLYTPTRAVIMIDSDTIFDESGCFEPGLFGFYNYSQANARYLDFNYELYVDYQIENQNVCFGDSAQFFFIDTSGCAGANAFSNLDTFYWDMGDGTILNDTNPWHIYNSADTFLVSLIATNINGCTDTMTKEIYIHPPAQAHIDFDNNCYADSSYLFDNSFLPMGGNVVSWDWDMGDNLGNDTVENPTYHYGSAGNYNVSLIIETNAGCIDTVDTMIQIYGLPDVDFNYTNACEGFAVTLQDQSQATTWPIAGLEWDVDTDAVAEYYSLNPSHVYNNYGIYPIKLKVTDSIGCQDSVTKNITVHPIPDADFYIPGVCHNDASQLIDSTTVALGDIQTWEWDYGDGNNFTYTGANPPQPGPTHVYGNPGPKNVQLIVTSDSGCVDSITKTIQVYYLPVANFFADTVCDNQNTQFTQASFNQSGLLSYYKWEFGDGDSAFSASPQHNYTTPGLHFVTLTVESNLGCEDTVIRPIRVYPTPNTAFGWQNNVCEGDPLPFYDQSTIAQVTPGGDQIVAWQWIFNSSDTQTIQNPIYQTTEFEDIQVYLRTWSNYGCTTYGQNTASIFPLPTANFTFDPACAEDSSKFTNTSKVQNGVISQTSWIFGDGGVSSQEYPYHTYLLPGMYNVTLEASSNKGCVDVVEKEIVIPATPKTSFEILPDLGCSPLKVTLVNTSSISTGQLEYEWYYNDSLFSIASDPDFIIENDTIIPTEHSIRLVAISELGCRNVSNQESAITVLPAPIAAFDLAELSYNMYNPEVEFVNASRYGVKWWWSFGDGALSEDFAPVHTYQQSGEYPVQQVVWNEWGCADTARRPVSRIAGSTDVTGSGFFQGEQWYLVINPITTLYIPNSFTPNGDGDNDFWFVEGFNEGKKFEITVFNRWGEIMFEGDNMNYRWDGLMPNSNKYAPIGTYVYVIRFMTSDDKEREVQGSFSLIR